MTQQFKFGDHDSIARQSTTQLADLLRLAIELNSPEYHAKPPQKLSRSHRQRHATTSRRMAASLMDI